MIERRAKAVPLPTRLRLAASLACVIAAGAGGCTAASGVDPSASFITPAPPGGSSSRSDGGSDAPAAELDSTTTAADVDFVRAMIAHHEQAVELAGLAPGRVDDPELAAIAERIVLVQSAEATQLRTWLERRSSRDLEVDAHEHAGGMTGEISRSTLDRAAELEGSAFDRLFVGAMVAHHRGAIEMSEARLTETGDSAVARWARGVATAQSLEIDRLLAIEARLPQS